MLRAARYDYRCDRMRWRRVVPMGLFESMRVMMPMNDSARPIAQSTAVAAAVMGRRSRARSARVGSESSADQRDCAPTPLSTANALPIAFACSLLTACRVVSSLCSPCCAGIRVAADLKDFGAATTIKRKNKIQNTPLLR
jgi:hypothetical protein